MSLQRQHFLLSYLKTLSGGPAGINAYTISTLTLWKDQQTKFGLPVNIKQTQ